VSNPDIHSAYREAGVDYTVLDAGKRSALEQALATSHWLAGAGARAFDESRGEPAFVLRVADSTLAFVLETLGTKSVIAREYHELTGANHFADVAYDTVAAVLNDLVCVGALPLVLNAYFATGSSAWYEREDRAQALLEGWRRGCDDARCAWGGGESPALTGLVHSQEIELAGSALGVVPAPGEPLLGATLAAGDEIVLVASTGLHANGASLARRVAAQLPQGLLTPLPGDGHQSPPSQAEGTQAQTEGAQAHAQAHAQAQTEGTQAHAQSQPPATSGGERFGEALLRPSALYVELVRALLAAPEIQLTYLSHITGHGLLKLMRPRRSLCYQIHTLPPVPPVLALLAQHAGLAPDAAYSTLNMGAGFAVYCRPGGGEHVVAAAASVGLDALLAGVVREGPRQVILEPLDVVYRSDQLELAPQQHEPAASGASRGVDARPRAGERDEG
jgi:phosphoribosylformylglycinamidine cyclo-ligase